MTFWRIEPEELGRQLGLAGGIQLTFAHQRVDLAVVADHAIGMGELPVGEVFVEKRECTSAMPLAKRSSRGPGEAAQLVAISIPL